ncbi:hypothetical protein MYVALT_F_02980 [Candidatus Vallotia tarda]|uniref:Uncharacterized protein n=1 Tax=Candidatus Vallotiella hemipterorum TaxID=1177213 RepID=A0A916JW04_9BURK|nr:hypothetical protein MYVALT_F_02980 [Candidatus Vallotia tarda]
MGQYWDSKMYVNQNFILQFFVHKFKYLVTQPYKNKAPQDSWVSKYAICAFSLFKSR